MTSLRRRRRTVCERCCCGAFISPERFGARAPLYKLRLVLGYVASASEVHAFLRNVPSDSATAVEAAVVVCVRVRQVILKPQKVSEIDLLVTTSALVV